MSGEALIVTANGRGAAGTQVAEAQDAISISAAPAAPRQRAVWPTCQWC